MERHSVICMHAVVCVRAVSVHGTSTVAPVCTWWDQNEALMPATALMSLDTILRKAGEPQTRCLVKLAGASGEAANLEKGDLGTWGGVGRVCSQLGVVGVLGAPRCQGPQGQ